MADTVRIQIWPGKDERGGVLRFAHMLSALLRKLRAPGSAGEARSERGFGASRRRAPSELIKDAADLQAESHRFYT